MIKQHTIEHSVGTTGIGLHSGSPVQLTLHPSAVDTGIQFRRTDIATQPLLKAHFGNINDTLLSSDIVIGEHRVATIEHLMSAIAALGIDNLVIDIDAAEVPIMDGSASPYLYLLKSAGLQEQQTAKRYLKVNKTVRADYNDAYAELRPYKACCFSFEIAFDHPSLRNTKQEHHMEFNTESFTEAIARARTFGIMSQIEGLRKSNKILGGSLSNAIVLDQHSILNPDGLRYRNEFVRHKILDAVGDMYTINHAFIGHYHGHKAGHKLNNMLLRNLFADPDSYSWVSFDAPEDAPIAFENNALALSA